MGRGETSGAMNDVNGKGLLPPGMNDILPPEAGFETATVNRLLGVFHAHGYAQVKPPLVEFEASLLAGAGTAMTQQTFRLMDPVSHAMLGLRADMTLQVARIATTRLAHEARPLRLCYAGQVLQVSGSQMRPERQVGQAGIELIGTESARADVEVIALAHEALSTLGIEGLSVDLNVPTLVPAICAALNLDEGETARVRVALDSKDAGAIAALGNGASNLLTGLLKAAGPAEAALAALAALELPAAAAAACASLKEIVTLLAERVPGIRLTVDPVENRGFEYHTGIAFVLFALGARGELGRGGRYLAGGAGVPNGAEPATGFTLFMDTVISALSAAQMPERVFVPLGDGAAVAQLQADGWITVAGLDAAADPVAEAQRLGCTHVYKNGRTIAVADA
jgi:ATP phosphoribosyltransferase regulatory subunit